MKRFNGICIITRQVRSLANFYCMVLQTSAEGDDTHTVLLTGGAILTIFSEQGMEQMAPGSMKNAGRGGYAMEFQVEDVDREFERLGQNGVEIVKPPATYPWGSRSAWFRDPDGNIIDLYTVVSGEAQAANNPPTDERVRTFFQRLLNEKDLSVCDEMLSADYVDHDALPGTPPGPQSAKEFVAGFVTQYPDMHVAVQEVFAAGNQAAARLEWRGTHRQTGEVFHQVGIVMLRFNDRGQMAERWSAYGSA